MRALSLFLVLLLAVGTLQIQINLEDFFGGGGGFFGGGAGEEEHQGEQEQATAEHCKECTKYSSLCY